MKSKFSSRRRYNSCRPIAVDDMPYTLQRLNILTRYLCRCNAIISPGLVSPVHSFNEESKNPAMILQKHCIAASTYKIVFFCFFILAPQLILVVTDTVFHLPQSCTFCRDQFITFKSSGFCLSPSMHQPLF